MAADVTWVAIVTGGAGGLGRAITARLRADGFRVAVADLDADRDAAAAHRAGDPGLIAVPVDVADASSPAAMRDEVLGRWGRIDVLVNNAGIGQFAALPARPYTLRRPSPHTRYRDAVASRVRG